MFQWSAVVELSDSGKLLRDFLRSSLGISQRMLYNLKYHGEIKLNGERVNVRAKLATGDLIELALEETDRSRVEPEDLPIKLIYEDDDLLIVNKPANMLVHPLPNEQSGSLANAIAHHWLRRGEDRPVRIITRLDRNTSGLVIVAKHALAQHFYASGTEHLDKYYLAVVEGCLTSQQGMIEAPIAVKPDNPILRTVHELGLPAQTEYQTISRGTTLSLVRARLITGRTHQIRVHFSSIGHPILGDSSYREPIDLIARQALHCYGLRLIHVRQKTELCFIAPLPEDILTIVSQLEKALD